MGHVNADQRGWCTDILHSPPYQLSIKNTGAALNQRAAKGLELYAEGERRVDETLGKTLQNTQGLSLENHQEGKQTSGRKSNALSVVDRGRAG